MVFASWYQGFTKTWSKFFFEFVPWFYSVLISQDNFTKSISLTKYLLHVHTINFISALKYCGLFVQSERLWNWKTCSLLQSLWWVKLGRQGAICRLVHFFVCQDRNLKSEIFSISLISYFVKPHKISAHSDNFYSLKKNVIWMFVWMSWNLARFYEILNQTDAKNFSFLSWQTKKFYF